ncbi:MAG: tetratricopeptide repeat protein [Gammaproteobacteria bacterium]|nr:tetratricopeptide repeat protein [Gammaproteobacteria bacterium]
MLTNPFFRVSTAALLLMVAQQGWGASDITRAEVRKTQGVAELQQGNYSAALDHFRQAETLNSGDGVTQYYLGLILTHQGEYTSAIPHLTRALTHPVVGERARYELGFIAYRQQQHPRAIELLKEVVARNHDHLRGHYYLALALRHQQQNRQSLSHLEPVIAAGGTLSPAAAYLRIAILQQLHEYTTVTAEAEIYPHTYPNSPYTPQVEIVASKAETALRRNRRWRANLTAGVSYDTNVTVEPDDAEYSLEEAPQKEDWRLGITADSRYALIRSGAHRARIGVKLDENRHQQASDYDGRRVGVVADYSFYRNGIFTGAEYNFSRSWLGGKAYTKTQSISPYLSFSPTENHTSLLQMSISQKDYLPSEFELDDYDGISSYLAYRHSVKQKSNIWHGTVNALNGGARVAAYRYRGFGGGLAAETTLASAQLILSANFSRKQYDENSSNRSDDNLSLSCELRYPLGKTLSLEGRFSHTKNESNLPQQSYQRQITGLHLRWKL